MDRVESHTEIEQSDLIDDQENNINVTSLTPSTSTSGKRGDQARDRTQRSDKQKEQTARLTRIRFLRQQEVANRLGDLQQKLSKLEERMISEDGGSTPANSSKPKKVVRTETVPLADGKRSVNIVEEEASFPEVHGRASKRGDSLASKTKKKDVSDVLEALLSMVKPTRRSSRIAAMSTKARKSDAVDLSSDNDEEDEEADDDEYSSDEEDEEEESVRARPSKKAKVTKKKEVVHVDKKKVAARASTPAPVYASSAVTSRRPMTHPACFWSWS